ncbi:MAG: hypothetical protein EZS28_018561, partial [Streblomastix strix]
MISEQLTEDFDYHWVLNVDCEWENYFPDAQQIARAIGRCCTSLEDFRDRYIYPKRRLLFLHRIYFAFKNDHKDMRLSVKIANVFFNKCRELLRINKQLRPKGFEEGKNTPNKYEESHELKYLPKGTFKPPMEPPQRRILEFTPWYRDRKRSKKSNDEEVIETERERGRQKEQEEQADADIEHSEKRERQIEIEGGENMYQTDLWGYGAVFSSVGEEEKVIVWKYDVKEKKFVENKLNGKVAARRSQEGFWQLNTIGGGTSAEAPYFMKGPFSKDDELGIAKVRTRTHTLCQFFADRFNTKIGKRKRMTFANTTIVELPDREGKPRFLGVQTNREEILAGKAKDCQLIYRAKGDDLIVQAFQHFLYLNMGNEFVLKSAIGKIETDRINVVIAEACTVDYLKFWAGDYSKRSNNIMMEFVKSHSCMEICDDARVSDETAATNVLDQTESDHNIQLKKERTLKALVEILGEEGQPMAALSECGAQLEKEREVK